MSHIVWNNGGVFSQGQIAGGTVVLVRTRPVTTKFVRLDISGIAHVHWINKEKVVKQEPNGRLKKKYHDCHYSNNETFIDENIDLWSSPGLKSILPEGTYELPFSFRLPINSPPSFESAIGSIRYKAKINVDGELDDETERVHRFQVRQLADHNWQPRAIMPFSETARFTTFFPPGNFQIKVEMWHSAFVVNRMNKVRISVTNRSFSVIRLRLCLLEIAVHLGRRQSEPSIFPRSTPREQTIVKKKILEFKSDPTREKEIDYDLFIDVPDFPPTFHTSVIKVEYVLQVKCDIEICEGSSLIKIYRQLLDQKRSCHYSNLLRTLKASGPIVLTSCPIIANYPIDNGFINMLEHDANRNIVRKASTTPSPRLHPAC
ncbi:unnamed protein product [Caenorhabditis bovis]|uniref:Arrestin C-terminal-like domain-containing protein n=1 Tax=Caenorhabditis bovis TaxID=2654633 RepID=A0A8S1EYG4_9PELO|nr:unnamed protein product [Caenorhabditis bovis]